MTGPTNFKVALACGAAGAYVDCSDYLRVNEQVTLGSGRQSQFDDTPPGVFSFTLDNADGRFTPDNTGSALVTRLTEGMGVNLQIGSRFRKGTIRSVAPFFRSSLGASAQVRVTCDDMLGDAARQDLSSFPDALTEAAGQYLLWRLDEPTGALAALEANGGTSLLTYNLPPYSLPAAAPIGGWAGGSKFGADPQSGVPGTRTQLTGSTTVADGLLGNLSGGPNINYPSTGMGCWGFWVNASSTGNFSFEVATADANPAPFFGASRGFGLYYTAGSLDFAWYTGSLAALWSVSLTPNTPHYISLVVDTAFSAGSWRRYFYLYIDGVLATTQGDSLSTTSLTAAEKQPVSVTLRGWSTTTSGSTLFSRLSHTATQVHEEVFLTQTAAALFDAVEYASPTISIDTLPADLSTAPTGIANSSSSALARLNEIVRTEQGYLYTETTGTLTAPVQKIKVRARTRPAAVSYSFDVATEVVDAPDFTRNLADMVSTVTVTGPASTINVVDSTLVTRVGSANSSSRIVNTQYSDMLGWGQDRIQRGVVTGVPVVSITVNARNTPTNRWSDLTSMVFGDRIRVTGLPSTQLGYSTWDGWLIGVKESHDGERADFTLYLSPVLPATGIFDTNRFMADGALTLSAAIVSTSATSMSVATTGPKLETTDVPYDLLIDSEQVTVTACNSATPQVATITRGVNGTTAATHTTSAVIELATSSLYAF